ncbi:hypothetical protein SALBM311S_06904 [Streptomyces alboniger]|jgi:hypothetical protein
MQNPGWRASAGALGDTAVGAFAVVRSVRLQALARAEQGATDAGG